MTAKVYCILAFTISSVVAQAQSAPSMIPDISYPTLEKLVMEARINYPRIKVFEHRVNATLANYKKYKLSWFDIFSLNFLYSPNNTTTLTNPAFLNGYQIGVFLNIGSFIQKPMIIKQAREEWNVTQFERDEYYVNLEALVRERYFLYLQQLALLKVKAKVELDAESQMQQVKYKYEKGEETLENYNKTLINLSDRTQAKIETEGAMLVAKSRLEELVGKRLEEIMQQKK